MSQYNDNTNYYQIASNTFFPTTMGIGVIGNIMLLMVIVKRSKDMRSSSDIFMANLAIANLVILIVWGSAALFDVNSDITHHNEIACDLLSFTETTVNIASVLILLVISVERFYTVFKPLVSGYFWTKNKAFRICIVVWAVAAVFSSLQLVFPAIQPGRNSAGISFVPLCRKPAESHLREAYVITSESLFFFLPFIVLLVFYFIMFRLLRAAETPSFNNIAAREHRTRVVSLFATVSLCFFGLQLPYRVLSLLHSLNYLESLQMDALNLWSFISRILFYPHSAVNPIVYNLMSKKFRTDFKNVC